MSPCAAAADRPAPRRGPRPPPCRVRHRRRSPWRRGPPPAGHGGQRDADHPGAVLAADHEHGQDRDDRLAEVDAGEADRRVELAAARPGRSPRSPRAPSATVSAAAASSSQPGRPRCAAWSTRRAPRAHTSRRRSRNGGKPSASRGPAAQHREPGPRPEREVPVGGRVDARRPGGRRDGLLDREPGRRRHPQQPLLGPTGRMRGTASR